MDDGTRSEPVDLGDEVWLVDTRMGGYSDITAGYLIRGERPCLVETGAASLRGRGGARARRAGGRPGRAGHASS